MAAAIEHIGYHVCIPIWMLHHRVVTRGTSYSPLIPPKLSSSKIKGARENRSKIGQIYTISCIFDLFLSYFAGTLFLTYF